MGPKFMITIHHAEHETIMPVENIDEVRKILSSVTAQCTVRDVVKDAEISRDKIFEAYQVRK